MQPLRLNIKIKVRQAERRRKQRISVWRRRSKQLFMQVVHIDVVRFRKQWLSVKI